MATVLSIITQALTEIGVYSQGETLSAADSQVCLLNFQRQIDSWAADMLTLSVQSEVSISWPSATSTQTIGPGGDVDIQRPVWISELNYVNPGSSPAVEIVMGPMDRDSYANQSIKGLQSGLPQQYFYQTSLDTVVGTLFIWPQPTTGLTLKLYAPKAVDVPVALSDTLLGPPGYLDAYIYQLALRLVTPFSRQVPPLLPSLATDAFLKMKRPNIQPGLMGVDQALVPTGGSAYNVLSDTGSAPSATR